MTTSKLLHTRVFDAVELNFELTFRHFNKSTLGTARSFSSNTNLEKNKRLEILCTQFSFFYWISR